MDKVGDYSRFEFGDSTGSWRMCASAGSVERTEGGPVREAKHEHPAGEPGQPEYVFWQISCGRICGCAVESPGKRPRPNLGGVGKGRLRVLGSSKRQWVPRGKPRTGVGGGLHAA